MTTEQPKYLGGEGMVYLVPSVPCTWSLEKFDNTILVSAYITLGSTRRSVRTNYREAVWEGLAQDQVPTHTRDMSWNSSFHAHGA